MKELLLGYLHEPRTREDVAETVDVRPKQVFNWLKGLVANGVVVLDKRSKPPRYLAVGAPQPSPLPTSEGSFRPAEAMIANVRELLLPYLDEPRTDEDVARTLDVQKNQASIWLDRLVTDGEVERLKGARYQTAGAAHSTPLFFASGSEEPTPGPRP